MPAPRETIWDIEPHTIAKHAILKRYFDGWLPILTSTIGAVLFIDGFAGPGVYRGGQPGSPIIVLKAAKGHTAKIRGRVDFLFVEKHQRRFESLRVEVAKLGPLPGNFPVILQQGKFEDLETQIDEVHGRGRVLIPTLAFIDPFGFTGFPMRLIAKLMKNPRTEVIITLMVRDLDRFGSLLETQANELFGGDEWKQCQPITAAVSRRTCLVAKYRERLRDAGANYTLAFEMADVNGNTIYYLVYGTTHPKGMQVMKDAMVYVDKTMNYRFADLVPFEQRRLIQFGLEESWLNHAAEVVWKRFSGQVAGVEQIEEYVLCEAIFPFRKKILRNLLESVPPAVEYANPPSRFATFPDRTRLRFRPYP